MVDGLAAVELGTVLLDPASESRPTWKAGSTPAPVALFARAVFDRVSEQLSVVRAASHLAASPRAFNLVVSNIPGPRLPLYMLDCELKEVYPAR